MTSKIKLNFNGKELDFFFGLSFLGEFLKEEKQIYKVFLILLIQNLILLFLI